MKFKSLAPIVCAVMLMTSSQCFATVDSGKIALGGVVPGIGTQELINSCGQPLFKDSNGDDWQYQNFEVEVKYGVVEEISTKSNAVATPDGIRVGNAAEVLSSTFGKADKVEVENDGTEYTYYSTDQTKKIEFKVVNGVISKITCEIRD